MPRVARQPLPLPTDNWVSRWLMFPSARTYLLHRVSAIDWWVEDGALIRGSGVTLCGRRGFLHMPGVLGRLGGPRCPECCKRLGIPEGEGNPYNEGMDV
jgi:hypothetical protein